MKNKAIFLDRDDTIIYDKHYLNDPEQIDYIEDSFEALKRWHDAGYLLIVVTNQSGIAKEIVSVENLEIIHQRIQDRYEKNGSPIHAFFYSPYASDSNHPSRKPNPGMLLEAQKLYQIDMSQSWMIGDRESDVLAGVNAGCQSILLKTANYENTSTQAALTCDSLLEACDFILNK